MATTTTTTTTTTDSSYSEDCSFFSRTSLPTIDLNQITPFQFYRDYVASSQPCKLHNCFNHWPANKLWNDENDSIVERCGQDLPVTCNFTPNGHGDHIYDHTVFVKPEERTLPFGDAWNRIKHQTKKNEGVPYLSFQNDSFRTQFQCLEKDIDVNGLDFANRVFQGKDRASNEVAAVNLWIGDERSVSSVHKDPFDNIYCVVRGTKTFTLLPPSDVRYLGERAFPSASYKHNSITGDFDIIVDQYKDDIVVVPWCEVDPLHPNLTTNSNFQYASPLHIEVNAGETLFIPALWYHRVGSKNVTIAVNYWYEMSFGPVYTSYQLARRLSNLKPEHEYNKNDLTEKQLQWLLHKKKNDNKKKCILFGSKMPKECWQEIFSYHNFTNNDEFHLRSLCKQFLYSIELPFKNWISVTNDHGGPFNRRNIQSAINLIKYMNSKNIIVNGSVINHIHICTKDSPEMGYNMLSDNIITIPYDNFTISGETWQEEEDDDGDDKTHVRNKPVILETFRIERKKNITFINLNMKGMVNEQAIDIIDSKKISIINCDFSLYYKHAILFHNIRPPGSRPLYGYYPPRSSASSLSNCTFQDCGQVAIIQNGVYIQFNNCKFLKNISVFEISNASQVHIYGTDTVLLSEKVFKVPFGSRVMAGSEVCFHIPETHESNPTLYVREQDHIHYLTISTELAEFTIEGEEKL